MDKVYYHEFRFDKLTRAEEIAVKIYTNLMGHGYITETIKLQNVICGDDLFMNPNNMLVAVQFSAEKEER